MMPGPDLAFILKTSFGQGRPTARGVAFLPQCINPAQNATRQLIVPRLGMAGIAFGWFFLPSSFMAHMRYFESPQFRLRLERFTGLLLISFGIKLILGER